MKCPYCGNLGDKVVDSRESKEGDVIRRRRQCLNCAKRFTSRERIEAHLSERLAMRASQRGLAINSAGVCEDRLLATSGATKQPSKAARRKPPRGEGQAETAL